MDNLNAMDVVNTEHPCSQENTTKTMTWNTESDIPFLPPEILFSIFPLAIPPYDLMDTTLNAGKSSTWNQALRLMKSIVLVCRAWYDVGIILLYENICIRRGQELESLRQTVTSFAAKNLGLLVKSLAIQCYIPEDNFDFCADVEKVLGSCTSLSTFSCNTPFVFPAQVLPIPFPAYITHFRLEGCFDYFIVLPILKQLEETLLSLHLVIRGKDLKHSWEWEKLLSSHLCLSSLRYLAVDQLGDCWEMPSLQRLTLVESGLFSYDYNRPPSMQPTIISFLSKNGHQILQLHFALEGFRFHPVHFMKVLKCCPRLVRIIMHPSTFQRQYWTNLDEFTHPNLRCVDLTYYLRSKDDYLPSELCLSKKNLPLLQCVRHFCNLPDQLHKWLDGWPPIPEVEMDEFVIDVFHHQLVCREGLYVWMLERDVLEDRVNNGEIFSGSFTVWEDADSDSDSDYVPTNSDEEGSSDEWRGDNSDSDGSDYVPTSDE